MKTKVLFMTLVLFGLTAQAQGLKDAVGKYFLIGAAINVNQSNGQDALADKVIRQHFNSIVAENCMKSEEIQPREGEFNWDDADRFVSYGKKNKLSIIGHCLVWHSQAPRWFFTGKDGKTVGRDEMIRRMTTHIRTLVGRYKGKIHGWDVVNEAYNDDGTMRQTPFYRIIGRDYIEIAFKAAHEADPQAELYYNDFSMSKQGKRDSVCALVKRLKADGCRIDAVGMQSHNGMDYPDLAEYEKSIDAFAACGVKVMMTELDLNALPSPTNFSGANVSDNFAYQQSMNPYAKGLPDSVAQKIDKRYAEFFDVYYRHRTQISRVTLWGVSDKDSWLNDWPIFGRTNYPLLFDRNYQAKPVVKEIIDKFNQ
jgi:endo-1,4-beta-xylanase